MYLKVLLGNQSYEVDIEDDKIFTRCVGGCNDEIHVDGAILREMLQEGATFEGTKITCPECASKK